MNARVRIDDFPYLLNCSELSVINRHFGELRLVASFLWFIDWLEVSRGLTGICGSPGNGSLRPLDSAPAYGSAVAPSARFDRGASLKAWRT